MAFVKCKLCNRVREVQPHGPAYSTPGYCYFHINGTVKDELMCEDAQSEPINTPKRKVITLDQKEIN